MVLCVGRCAVSTTALMLLTLANGASALQRTPFWRETARLHTAFCSRFPLTLSPDLLSQAHRGKARLQGAGTLTMSSVLRKTCVRMAATSQIHSESGAWLESSPALASSLPPSLPSAREA